MAIRRFTSTVAQMGLALRKQCGMVTMAAMILDEDGADPRAAEVRKQLQDMAESCRQACDKFNKLRALTGDLEAAIGVTNPTFYVAPYTETGDPVVCGGKCTCGQLTLGDAHDIVNT